jgi:hypothetical protein
MSANLRPYFISLTDYTQVQEDAFALTLAGKNYGWSILYNTTIPAVRVWDGAAFITVPDIFGQLLALATSSVKGAVPSFGSALQVLRVDAGGTGMEWATMSSAVAWGAITGTLSSQTDLQTELNLKANLISPSFTTPSLGVATATSINGLTITSTTGTLTLSTFTVTASGNATISGTNTGDQTSIVGITGTMAQFDTACTDGNFVFQQRNTVSTTDATTTTIETIPIATDSIFIITSKIKCRKISGAGVGTAGQGNTYIRTVRVLNSGGTLNIGAISSDYTSEQIAIFNATFAISGTNLLVRVTGAASDNVDWECETIKS